MREANSTHVTTPCDGETAYKVNRGTFSKETNFLRTKARLALEFRSRANRGITSRDCFRWALEGELQAELNDARRPEGEHAGSGTDAVHDAGCTVRWALVVDTSWGSSQAPI